MFSLALFILAHGIAGATENELPSNYQLFLDELNWVDAELFCQQQGGHLVSIHDEATNLQIANYLLTTLPSHTSYSWIGFNQVDSTWTDNSPHEYTPGLDQNPQGECTTISADSNPLYRGYWMGPPCNNAYPFICDIPPIHVQSVDYIISDCLGNEIERTTFTIDECQFGPLPHKYVCDDTQLVLQYYTAGDNCDGELLTQSTSDSAGQCVAGSITSSTCGISVPTTSEQPTSTLVHRLCTDELHDVNVGAIYYGIGGCQQHFKAIITQDTTGLASFSDCLAKCKEYGCKSFSFGRKGVPRENWCNIYSQQCTIGSDQSWYMFTLVNNAELICNSIHE